MGCWAKGVGGGGGQNPGLEAVGSNELGAKYSTRSVQGASDSCSARPSSLGCSTPSNHVILYPLNLGMMGGVAVGVPTIALAQSPAEHGHGLALIAAAQQLFHVGIQDGQGHL